MSTMRALMKLDKDRQAVQEIPVPEVGPGQVLVRMRAASICGTDSHIYRWNAWAQSAGIPLPLIMGHEGAGDVVACGPGVTHVRPGDRVALESHVVCGQCVLCRTGRQHICREVKVLGVHTDGCFAEYSLVPAYCARPLPASLSYEIGALMEPFGIAFRAVEEAQPAGETVLVLGSGPIGVMAAATAVGMGAARVILSGTRPERLAKAAALGVRHTVCAQSESLVERVKEITAGEGVDVLIECSGNPAAVKDGFSVLKKGGRVWLIGLPSEPLVFAAGPDLVFKEATVHGIHGRKMFATWEKMYAFLEAGLIDLSSIATHRFDLQDFDRAFAATRADDALKVQFIL